VQDPFIAEHTEPLVRGGALLATADLLRAVPPARLAGALLRGDTAPDDAAWAARLTALHERLRGEAGGGEGAMVRDLAGGCLALQAALADDAMAALEAESQERAGGGIALHAGASSGRPDVILPWW
jgi:hypothetical protein